MSTRNQFLILNILGGMAVLGSYAWGIGLFPDLRDDFWGGVPEGLRGFYTLNMFLAAGGYIAIFSFFMLRERPENFARLYLPYVLILIPSALWLPLTVWVLLEPGIALWWLLRIDLLAVGLGGLMLYPALWRTEAGSRDTKKLLSIALFFFCLQTAVLDALVWPYYFELPMH